MTSGSTLGLILRFSIPLILTNIGQQLYSVVDAIVVGRGVGVEAFAALGATDWSYWLDLWMMQSLTAGFGVLVSQTFGSGNRRSFRRAVAMSVTLCLIIGVCVTIAAVTAAAPLLRLLDTPENIFAGAQTYLTAMYGGTLIIIAYNMSAAFLRAVGDGKSPLIAMGIAGALNVILDIVFVFGFKTGIIGAAVATLLAQLFAFLYCLRIMMRSDVFRMQRSDWTWDGRTAARLCKLGIPLAMQSFITVIGGVIAQSVINSFGYIVVAGCTADNKLHGCLDCSSSAIESADSTYAGQNWGAKQTGRIRRGVMVSCAFGLIIAFAITGAMFIWGRQIVGLFISSDAENAAAVLEVAYQYLIIMAAFLWTTYLMHVFRGTLQGMGNSICPMLSGIVEFIARVGCVMLLPRFIGQTGLFFMDGMAWASAGVFLGICYFVQMHFIKKREHNGTLV